MKYVIKGKHKDTREVVNCEEFKNKESAQFYFEKLNKAFSKGYDFWIETQTGTVKIIRNYKTK
jgi:hypothetical protein